MKTITENEIDELLAAQQILIGAELQQVRYNEKALQLNFYKTAINYWLTISLKPGIPYFFLTSQKVRLVANQKKPVSLFLAKYFIKSKLLSLQRRIEWGRVVELDFGQAKKIQVSLITGRVNISVSMDHKIVHAYKPKEMTLQESQMSDQRETREPNFFETHWQKGQASQKTVQEIDTSKILQKKQKGLEKMQESLLTQENNSWLALGYWLKGQRELDQVPEEYKDLVDVKQSLAWNIENAFKQKKKLEGKKQGTLKRIDELKIEISKLENGKLNSKEQGKDEKSKQSSLLYQADLKGKTIDFLEGRLFIGKSGQDNLKLLRKAKAWYLWLHIKDYPGAYGIFEKLKSSEVSDKVMIEAAQAVIRQSLPKNQKGRFELIYTECRYVRPIKGAKSGQVTYSHEKVISVKV